MKIIEYLAIALTLSLMFVFLTACSGTSVKDDFKEYVNNNASAIFIPENNDIVATYTKAIESQDVKIAVKALSETLFTKNNALLEKMKAYKPETTEVQELHNIYIKAVELRKEGYAQMLEALTTKVSDESAADAAIAKLGESDTKFAEFETKASSMKKDLGLVDAK